MKAPAPPAAFSFLSQNRQNHKTHFHLMFLYILNDEMINNQAFELVKEVWTEPGRLITAFMNNLPMSDFPPVKVKLFHFLLTVFYSQTNTDIELI